jgi:hypothetical protein
VRRGKWTWDTPPLEKVDLREGLAPELTRLPQEKKLLRRAWLGFVEGI